MAQWLRRTGVLPGANGTLASLVMSPHTVVLTAALAALVCLPCAVFAMWRSEGPATRRALARRARADRVVLRRLDVGLGAVVDFAEPDACCCGSTTLADDLPAIEQVLSELRRLDQQRLGGLAQESEMWARAVLRAYDRWLQVACHYLAVSHHLSCLTDIDRDIERLRVEAELIAAGLPPIRTAEG